MPDSPALPIPSIIQRYLNGESMLDLAKESRTHARTLYRWMLTETGPDYEHIITDCLANRIADADLTLETATDSCQVARAREIAKFSRMDFERRRPKLYGPKQDIQIDNQVTVIVQRAVQPAPGPVVQGRIQSDSADSPEQSA